MIENQYQINDFFVKENFASLEWSKSTWQKHLKKFNITMINKNGV